MEQYINKSALIAEIERELDSIKNASTNFALGRKMELANILSFLNTLEEKGADLEKEAERFVQTKEFAESKESPVLLIAKHFYELGLKAKEE